MKRQLLTAFALSVILCLMLTAAVDIAEAQDSDKTESLEKKQAQKMGVKDSLADGKKKDGDKSDGPTKLQMGLGIGSVFVMIAVVKWL